MKKRRIMIVAFVLVAALTVGVGFAVYTTQIDVVGFMGYNLDGVAAAFDTDIELTGTPKITAYSNTGTQITGLQGNVLSATIDANDPDIGTITAKFFTVEGQKVLAIYQVQNKGSVGKTADLTISRDENSSSQNAGYMTTKIGFAATDSETNIGTLPTTYQLAPNESCYVYFEITTISVPDDTSAQEGKISWILGATSIDE